MSSPVEFPPVFDDIRSPDEQAVWAGRPARFPFLVRGVTPILAFCLMFSASALFISPERIAAMPMTERWILLAFGSLPIAFLVAFLIYRLMTWRNTHFVITDKRVLIRRGWLGIDYESVDMDRITDLRVDVSVMDKLMRVGTLQIHVGNSLFQSFECLSEPYAVFKRLKSVATDVKTDWKFPNALRPETNPGYRTRYEPDREKE